MNFRPVAGRTETLRFGACLAFCVLASSPGRTQQGPMPTDFGPYGPPLTLDMAKRAMEAADGIARKNGWNVAIAIVDSAEHLVLFQKFDNTLYASISVAEGKARTALKFRRPTKTLEDAITRGGNGLRYLSVRDITPLEGGIPIVSGGKVVGAIGVSGVASANDELTATAGAEALK